MVAYKAWKNPPDDLAIGRLRFTYPLAYYFALDALKKLGAIWRLFYLCLLIITHIQAFNSQNLCAEAA